ncbi:MAG: L-fucose/L-arabinose isomerase family protein [Aliihoeflea sp.]
MMARIGLLPLARATFDVPYAEALYGKLRRGLLAAGHDLVGGDALLFDAPATEAALAAMTGESLDLLLIVQVTFTDATMTVKIADEADVPLAIWSLPEPRTGGRLRLNAFCGLNLAAHALGLNDVAFGWVHADPATTDVGALAGDLLAGNRQANALPLAPAEAGEVERAGARALLARIAGSRIGRIGERPDGFFTCDYDSERLESLAGVSVEPIALDALFDAARNADAGAVGEARAEAAATLGDLDTVDQDQLDRSLRLRAALEDVRSKGGYSAFAVRCWPEMFTQYGGAVCGPVGMMGERRVPCACEADVHGALTNLFLQEMTGDAAFLVDLVDLDAEDGTAVVWHCGQAPVSMRDETVIAKAALHSNRKMPLLFEFPLKPGRVTFARISQARGHPTMVIAGGQMLRRPLAFSGTAGVLAFDAAIETVAETIIGAGLEHHLSLVYGDHRPALRALAAEMGLPVLEF